MADVLFNEQILDRDQRGKRNPNRLLLIVVIILALILVGELLFHLVLRPRLQIERIVVKSDLRIPDDELLRVAGLETAPYYYKVDIEGVEERIRDLPAVRDVEVSKSFPNTMTIRLEERTPLAMAFAEREGRTVPVVFDEHGVVFRWKDQISNWDLPVVSGLEFEDPSLGVRLPRYLTGFLKKIRGIQEQAPVLFEQISEYRIVPTGERDFEVLLYPQSYPVQVRVEPEVDARTCKYIFMVLDGFQREGSLDRIHELDFRGGEVVFRKKGDDGAR
jgi:cell division protein FtsQ